MAYSNMAQLRMLADDPDGTQEWGNRAVELARAFGDLDTEVHALNNVGTALMIAGDERGATILQESLDTALAHDLQEHVARAYTNLGATHVKHRRYAAGEEVLQAGIAFCADRDLDSWTSYMRGTRSHPAPRDRALGGGAVRSPTPSPPQHRGERQPRQRARGAGQARDPHRRRPGGRGRGLGGWPSRRARAQRVLICASGMAEAAWTRDDPDDIRRRVDAVWDLAVERGGPWDVGELLWWLHCAGEDRAAPRPVAEPFALMVGGRRGARPRRRGTPSGTRSGRRWPGRAPTIPTTCGPPRPGWRRWAPPPPSRRSCVTCAAGGTPVPRGPARDQPCQPGGADRTRDGGAAARSPRACPTPQIAARFVLSEKTVAHHVSAVLRKLQEPSRSRAVATARRTGLISPV